MDSLVAEKFKNTVSGLSSIAADIFHCERRKVIEGNERKVMNES
jgi:hypothetical protein